MIGTGSMLFLMAAIFVIGVVVGAIASNWRLLGPRYRTKKAKLLYAESLQKNSLFLHCLREANRYEIMGMKDKAEREMEWAVRYSTESRELQAAADAAETETT